MYMLLDHTKPTANVFQRINKTQRTRLDKRRLDAAYMRIAFVDRDGKNKVIRYKKSCPTIYQNEQIKEYGVLANESFTQREREEVMFRDGLLITMNETLQQYLEASPQFEDFWKKDAEGRVGYCDEILQPLYKIYNPMAKVLDDNINFKTRLKAGNKIDEIKTVEEAHAMMKRLFGAFYKGPSTIEECQNILVDWLDDATDEGIAALLRNELTSDEYIDILIGKAIDIDYISFDQVKDFVVKKAAGGQYVPVKEISSTYPLEERKNQLATFLVSDAGKGLKADLEKKIFPAPVAIQQAPVEVEQEVVAEKVTEQTEEAPAPKRTYKTRKKKRRKKPAAV